MVFGVSLPSLFGVCHHGPLFGVCHGLLLGDLVWTVRDFYAPLWSRFGIGLQWCGFGIGPQWSGFGIGPC